MFNTMLIIYDNDIFNISSSINLISENYPLIISHYKV